MISDLLDQYPKYHYWVASSQLVLAMVGMGAVLRFRDFVEIALEPKPFFTGAFFQLMGIPLIALGFVRIFDLPPVIAVGFFLVAAMPGGAMSNIYTFLGRGNTALSVALTGVMTLTALATAPLILRLFAAEHLPPEIPMPAAVIVREIALFLLLPLGAGMMIGRLSRHAARISRWTVRLSLVCLCLVIVGSLGSGRLDLGACGVRIPLLIIAFGIVIQGLAEHTSRHLLKFSWRDSTALGIESSMKNMNLALLIAASVFPLEGPAAEFGAGVLFVLLFYGGANLIIGASPALLNYRREQKRLAAEKL